MAHDMEFEKVLELFEENGWVLERIWKPYRVFVKEGELPFLIPVHEGRVNYEYIKKINAFFESTNEEESE